MARVLAYTSPARGHLFPVTPILDELAGRGHAVAVRTLATLVPTMLSRGFDAAPIDAEIERVELDDWKARSPRQALHRAVAGFVARSQYDAPDLRGAIDEERPDVVLVDINAWGALAAAEAWGGPWAAFCPYPMALSSADAPPFGPGLRPAAGVFGRLRDRVVRPLVLGTVERELLPELNKVRVATGVDALADSDEMFRRPPLLLYMTAEPFEYPRGDWPESVVMVGPCAWEPPTEAPPWLTELERPLVLVTTSSEFQNDQRLVEAAFAALADEPFDVIATLPAGDPGTLRPPPNTHLAEFVPHGYVLDRAVCAITHGGMGATQKALARGVPVCAVPFGRDQLEVARRVEVARAGSRLPARRLTPDRLQAKVREAIDCAAGAARVASAFAAAGGAATAADAVERRLLAALH